MTLELLPGKSWSCCPVELWHRTKVGYLVGPINRVAKTTTIFRRVGPNRLGSAGTAAKASLGGSKASSGSGQVAKMKMNVNLRQLRQRAGHRQHRQLTSARPCLFWIKRVSSTFQSSMYVFRVLLPFFLANPSSDFSKKIGREY